MAAAFAAGLNDRTCSDHYPPQDDCPYCRDTAALTVYRGKVSGECDWSWEAVVTVLAKRFQHFEECVDHGVRDADLVGCPFCRDEDWWRQYVAFCGRRGVRPVRRDAEIMLEGAVVVPLDEIRFS